MTPTRLIAIGLIFGCTSIAWAILGGTVVSRTGESDHGLRQEVESLWGRPQEQRAPTVDAVSTISEKKEIQETDRRGNEHTRIETVDKEVFTPIPLASSNIDVQLDLEHRKKGLMWFSTYVVDFRATYAFKNVSGMLQPVRIGFSLPEHDAVYDGFVFRIDGQPVSSQGDLAQGIESRLTVAPGETKTIEVAYKSRGLSRWTYVLGQGVQRAENFSLVSHTNFDDVDFAPGSISPTTRGAGTQTWTFDSLVTGKRIEIVLPEKLNPGPLVSRIAFFAPVSLLFFFTIMVILGMVRRQNLHPMNYFFLAGAFFAFHLLLAYLVDHMSIHVAFAIASATSVFLVVSYLRLVAGNAVAFLQAGLAQLVFLVMFSYSFFFEGSAGLSGAIGSVITLFVLMQVTAKVDWSAAMGDKPGHRPSGLPLPVPGLHPDEG